MTSLQPLNSPDPTHVAPNHATLPAGLSRVLVDLEGAAFMCSLSKSKFRAHIAPHVAQVKIGRTRLYYVESLKDVAAYLTMQGTECPSLHNINLKRETQRQKSANPLDALLPP